MEKKNSIKKKSQLFMGLIVIDGEKKWYYDKL